MKSTVINTLHGMLSLMLLGLAWGVRWIYAGLASEYGRRGPQGEYLYDLSDPRTSLSVHATGLLLGLGLVAVYWLLLVFEGRRRRATKWKLHYLFAGSVIGIPLLLFLMTMVGSS
ncbi:MAG: hypothetical protein AAGI68_16840 [Planctomycetota bacterium]